MSNETTKYYKVSKAKEMIEELNKKENKQKSKEEIKEKWRHDICVNCGHYRHLHLNFKDECDACDDPTISLDKKCSQFKLKEN